MKKRLAIVLSSISLVVGASYFITGKVIQNNYYDIVAKINAQPNVKVNVVNYKRGIIHSKTNLEIELASSADPNDRQLIAVKQVITHGPVIVANTADGFSLKVLAGQIKTTLGEPWQTKLADYTQQKHPLIVTTLVNFSKQANSWVKFKGFDRTDANQVHTTMADIKGEIQHDLNFANYHGSINLPELVMNKDNWQFKVNDLALKLDTHNQESAYSSSNELIGKLVSYRKNDQDVVKLDDVSAKLAFANANDKLTLDMLANIEKSQILQQQFTGDTFKIQANNLNRNSLKNLANLGRVSPKAVIDFVQDLTADSTNFTVELPKYFSEALLAYLSFEVYRSSPLGKYDTRSEQAVLQAISGSVNKLVQSAVKQKLFLDQGTYYALNYNQQVEGAVQVSPDANQG